MGREVRKVFKGWEHPQDSSGRHIPLLSEDFNDAVKEWSNGKEMWGKGYRRDYIKDSWVLHNETCSYAEYAGERPARKEYMPRWNGSQKTHFQMYEITSEGTPISPVMKTPEELAMWLVSNNASAFGSETATYEQWLRVCQGGYAPSAILDEKGFRSGVAF